MKEGVSFIVPVWREDTFESVCKPWIDEQVARYGAQLIEVRGTKSIFEALERGRRRSRRRFLVYVHDDVRLIAPDDFTPSLMQAFADFPQTGLFGPVGKVQAKRVPWWLNAGAYVGHWCRRGDRNQVVYQFATRHGQCPHYDVCGDLLEFCQNITGRWDRYAPAGFVDGFFLAEDRSRVNLSWDCENYPEQWHGYDMDRCCQVRKAGFDVMVGPWLFMHDNGGHAGYKGSDPTRIRGLDQANRRVNSVGDQLWLSDLDRCNDLVRIKWGLA